MHFYHSDSVSLILYSNFPFLPHIYLVRIVDNRHFLPELQIWGGIEPHSSQSLHCKYLMTWPFDQLGPENIKILDKCDSADLSDQISDHLANHLFPLSQNIGHLEKKHIWQIVLHSWLHAIGLIRHHQGIGHWTTIRSIQPGKSLFWFQGSFFRQKYGSLHFPSYHPPLWKEQADTQEPKGGSCCLSPLQ